MLKASNVPVINRKQFLRSLINNMKSSLLAVTTLSKEKCETLIKLLWYLETDDWSEGMNFTYGDRGIKEIAGQFGLSGRQCEGLQRI
jgi:hypothetical protein